MARDICKKCEYPVKTCLCHAISEVTQKTKIIVLQHPSEVNNKKNTVHLLTLLTKNIHVYVGEDESDFIAAKTIAEKSTNNCLLLYPSDNANSWQQHLVSSSNNNAIEQKNTLIVIDGTWRKAKKMYFLNVWLKKIPHITFNSEKQSNYAIRHTSIENGLSSIEAVAYILEEIEQIPPTAFINALDGLINSFTRLMPKDVQHRYRHK